MSTLFCHHGKKNSPSPLTHLLHRRSVHLVTSLHPTGRATKEKNDTNQKPHPGTTSGRGLKKHETQIYLRRRAASPASASRESVAVVGSGTSLATSVTLLSAHSRADCPSCKSATS